MASIILNLMSAIAFTLGLIAIICAFFLWGLPFGLILGLGAIVFSVLGKKINQICGKSTGLATAAFVLGTIAVCVSGMSSTACAFVLGEENYFSLVDSSMNRIISIIRYFINHYFS